MTYNSYVPDAVQHLLLTALLAQDETAARAAAEWLDRIDFDAITEGDIRLMPMFSHRLTELGIDHPLSGRIRGLYRRALYIDRTLRHDLAVALAGIAGVSRTPVVLKGPALGVFAYAKPTFRPFVDLDVLVPPEDLRRVLDYLEVPGTTVDAPVSHAVMVRLPNGREIDIHRSPYHMAFQPHHVRPLFERLRPLAAGVIAPGAPACFTLGDADQLLHTFAHGLRANDVAPIRWVVDAAMILRCAGGSFDWDLFMAEARRLELEAPALLGLREVGPFCTLPGLTETLARLERATTERALRRYRAEAMDQGPVNIWQMTRRNASGLARLRLFASFYRRAWGDAYISKFFRKLVPALGKVGRFARLRLAASLGRDEPKLPES
jgi:Uncharacterised nucleotidyltransferase